MGVGQVKEGIMVVFKTDSIFYTVDSNDSVYHRGFSWPV